VGSRRGARGSRAMSEAPVPSPLPSPSQPPRERFAPRDPAEVARHEAHLIGQIHHLITANQRLEEQVDRLAKVTEIAELFRQQRITRDTFELPQPHLLVPPEAQQAWARIETLLPALGGDPGALAGLREALGIVRTAGWQLGPDWIADVRSRLIAAEQSIAFLNEQTRELDMLRREKDSIVDGAARLEQNIDDLWKALNEKTTHIQRLESQLARIWASGPYRLWRLAKQSLRRDRRPGR